MSDDSKRESKVIKGQFREPKPPVSIGISLNIYEEVEQREDGPWLVVYSNGKKLGETPIKPGTEPKLKYAKVLPFEQKRREHEATDEQRESGSE